MVASVGTVDLSVSPDDQPVALSGARLFSGYSGWAPDQLEAELAEGAWFVLDAVAVDVFCVDAERLWHDVMRRQGGSCRCSPPIRRTPRSIDTGRLRPTPTAGASAMAPARRSATVRWPQWRSRAGGPGDDPHRRRGPQPRRRRIDAGGRAGRTTSCAVSSPPMSSALVEVLARAFDDDPVPQWLFRGDRRRRRGLRKFFTIQLRHTYLERGEVFTTQDLAGVAMWSPPGRARPGWRDLVRLVPVMPYLTGLGRDTPEAARLLSAVDAARPQDPHWYLATLGTDPDRQRTGVGSALIAVGPRPASTPKGSPRTWSLPRRAISPSTGNTGSR